MTILRFEKEPTKEQVEMAVDALKAVGLKVVPSQEKEEMTKEEFFRMINERKKEAREGKVLRVSREMQKKILNV